MEFSLIDLLRKEAWRKNVSMMYAQINEKSVSKPCYAQRTLKTELINDHGRSRSILRRHCSLAKRVDRITHALTLLTVLYEIGQSLLSKTKRTRWSDEC